MRTTEQEIAETATGICENPNGLGKVYAGPINRQGRVSDSGAEIRGQEILDHLAASGQVGIPNAGAGSYRKAFAALGFNQCEVFEQSSSAGDWSFAVCRGAEWYPAYQSNRYPRCGFFYAVDFGNGFATAEDCQAFMAGY